MRNIFYRWLFVFFSIVLAGSSITKAQYFTLNGNATSSGGDCYQITPDLLFKIGAIWYSDPIDLSKPFDLKFQMHFGTNNGGADGMVFVLQTVGNTAIGVMGDGIGFNGFSPSLGVEFDTYDNMSANSDIEDDHIAIHQDGSTDHGSANNLAGPISALPGGIPFPWSVPGNIEVDVNHTVRVHWEPSSKEIEIYFDCYLRLTLTKDIVTDIFGGNPIVYWGFTGATGGLSNAHSVCVETSATNTPDTLSVCLGSGDTIYSPSAGVGGSYSWFPNSDISSITSANPYVNPPSSTTYFVTATDACGFTVVDSVKVIVDTGSAIELGPDQNICLGNNTVLDATASGATYMWSNGDTTTTLNVTPVSDTSFSVTVTIASGCTSTDTVGITVQFSAVVDAGDNDTICPGGAATLIASGGISYVWETAETTASIVVSTVVTDTYSVTVTDGGGCTGIDSVSVVVVPLPVISLSNDTAICSGGVVLLTASGGSTYSWAGGETTATIGDNPTSDSIYFVTISDVYGCTDNGSISVIVNTSPMVELGNDTTICKVSPIILDATTAGAGYVWSTSATTAIIGDTISANTSYDVLVTDGNGCTGTDTVNVTIYPDVQADAGNDTLVCEGDAIQLTASGGTGYFWNGGETSASITISPVGSTMYYVTVSDGAGCTGVDSAFTTVAGLPGLTMSNDTAVCIGNSVQLMATGGATYLWEGGETSSTIVTVPSMDSYISVEAISASSCVATDSVFVAVNLLPVVDLGQDVVICEGSSVNLNAVISNGAYDWSTGEASGIITVTPVSTTQFYVNVTDVNQCSASDSILVVVAATLYPSAGQDTTICEGETIQLTASGGVVYFWNNGMIGATISISPATSTIYDVTADDGSGCTGMASVSVTVNSAPIVTINGDTVICQGSSINISASGGTTYLWNTGQSTASFTDTPGADTFYLVSISNLQGCTVDTGFFLTVLDSFVVDLGNDTAICEGASILLEVPFGSTFLWSTNETTSSISVSPLQNTNYSVIVTNGGSCVGTGQVTVLVNPVPMVSVTNDTSICPGSDATLSVAGGSFYLWSSGQDTSSIVVSPLSDSTFYVTVADLNNCSASGSTVVSIQAALVVDAGPDSYICSGVGTVLSASGGDAYVWSTAEITSSISVSPSTTSAYFVTVTVGQCSGMDSVFVIVDHPSIIPVLTLASVGLNCYGDSTGSVSSLVNNAVFPCNYSWNTGDTTSSIGFLAAGQYVLTLTDANYCNEVDSISIINPQQITISMEVTNDVLCPDTKTDISFQSISGGMLPMTYYLNGSALSGASISYSAFQTTDLIGSAVDVMGCKSIVVSEVINVADSLQVSLNADKEVVCSSEDVIINISTSTSPDILTYSSIADDVVTIITPVVKINPTTTGYYVFKVEDGQCFTVVDSILIEVSPSPIIDFTANNIISCLPDTITFTIDPSLYNPQYTYQWDFGDGDIATGNSEIRAHSYSVEGDYTVRLTATNTELCSYSAIRTNYISTGYPPIADFDVSATTISTMQPVVYFTNQSTGAEDYIWFFGDGFSSEEASLPHEYPAIAKEYTVLLQALTNGCMDEKVVVISIEDEYLFYVPNAFTPNNDEMNENFQVYVQGIDETRYHFMIYDRWGQVIFESHSTKRFWNGKLMGGETAPIGVYTWVATFMHPKSGDNVLKSGSVTVIY